MDVKRYNPDALGDMRQNPAGEYVRSSDYDKLADEFEAFKSGFGSSLKTYDEQYADAIAVVRETGKAAISVIQRRLKINYEKAARFIERMEAEGIVTYPDSHGRREVIHPA